MQILKKIVHLTALSLALASGVANAETSKFEAVISPKSDYSLEFADDSKHAVRLVQREGKTSGSGVLAGATMKEIGLHDLPLAQGTARGIGYLVFTKPGGDVAYLKFDRRGLGATDASGKQLFLLSGSWEVAGATGKLKGLKGLGTLRINVLSPNERQWLFEGDLILPAQAP